MAVAVSVVVAANKNNTKSAMAHKAGNKKDKLHLWDHTHRQVTIMDRERERERGGKAERGRTSSSWRWRGS